MRGQQISKSLDCIIDLLSYHILYQYHLILLTTGIGIYVDSLLASLKASYEITRVNIYLSQAGFRWSKLIMDHHILKFNSKVSLLLSKKKLIAIGILLILYSQVAMPKGIPTKIEMLLPPFVIYGEYKYQHIHNSLISNDVSYKSFTYFILNKFVQLFSIINYISIYCINDY